LFGQQIIANELDEVEGFNSRLLIGATGLTLKKICGEISKRGGLIIPAHVDRESFSLIGQLGFIPKDLPLDALEISSRLTVSEAMKRFPEISHFPLIRSSDAHFLEDIGSVTTSFLIAKPSIEEIRIALNRTDERQFKLEA
jgi:PHP family Zn ribbon phosphoesterase